MLSLLKHVPPSLVGVNPSSDSSVHFNNRSSAGFSRRFHRTIDVWRSSLLNRVHFHRSTVPSASSPWHIKGPSLMSLASSNKWSLKGKKIGNNKRESFKCSCNNKCNKYNKCNNNNKSNQERKERQGGDLFRGLL